jgi:hypothetical protein
MRFNIAASVVLALTVAACGSRGGFSDSRVAPLQPQPVGPVSSQPLPPPPVETQPFEPTTDMAAAPATPSAAEALEIRRPDLSGGWTIASGGENCQLFMSLTTWSGGYRANTRGCASDELKSIGAWDLNGKEIVLKDASGDPIARLYASATTQFSGQSTSGRGVRVFR